MERESDCAWLELDEAQASAVWLELGAAPSDNAWTAYGYPAFAAPIGVALTGVVMDSDAELPERLRGLALFSPMLGSHPPASVGGFSGSPVLVGSRVVGHLSSVLGDATAMKQPHLGYAYAVPSTGLERMLGRPISSQVEVPTQIATSQDTIVEQSIVYHALQLAASGAEVDVLLAQAGRQGYADATLRTVAAQVLIGLMLPDEALSVLNGTPGARAIELRALALSLKGDHAQAQAMSQALEFSAESRGIEGGILKRRWLGTRNPSFLRIAFQTYFEAWDKLRDHYPGINAAACALYLGKREQCLEIAAEIKAQLGVSSQRDAWAQASFAEACLLTSDLEVAKAEYKAATDALQGRARDTAVMCTQARRNLKYMKLAADALGDSLPSPPGVAAFTGHRLGKWLSHESIPWLSDRLSEVLDEQDVRFAFCSAASGSDILFIEMLLERGTEVQVFLPFPIARFRESSVGPDESWLARFDQLVSTLGPNRVQTLSEQAPTNDDPKPYVLCNEAIMKAAREKAHALGTSPFLIAVLAAAAEVDNPAPGGAAHAVQAWHSHGEKDVIKLDPGGAVSAG